MQTSIFLARLIGPFLIAIGLGLLVNGDIYQQMAAQFLQNLGLIYLSGLITLVAGLAIVNTHNVWAADWRAVITVLGWLAVVGGTVRIVVPQFVETVGTGLLPNRGLFVVAWLVITAIGLWLVYESYVTKTPKRAAPAARPARKRKR